MKYPKFLRKSVLGKISVLGIILLTGNLSAGKQTFWSNQNQNSLEIKNDNSLPKKDNIDVSIEELMKKYNIPGISIALLKNGTLSTIKNYGVLQNGNDEKINKETK